MEWRVVSEQAYLQFGRETFALRTLAGRHEVVRPPSTLDLYRIMTEDAVRRLRSGELPSAGLQDCLQAMELVDAIYGAAGPLPFPPRAAGD
jgi:hypothetical protein